MTDNERAEWVTVHEHEITVDGAGIPDGVTITTSREVLAEIDWPAAIHRHERNRG